VEGPGPRGWKGKWRSIDTFCSAKPRKAGKEDGFIDLNYQTPQKLARVMFTGGEKVGWGEKPHQPAIQE